MIISSIRVSLLLSPGTRGQRTRTCITNLCPRPPYSKDENIIRTRLLIHRRIEFAIEKSSPVVIVFRSVLLCTCYRPPVPVPVANTMLTWSARWRVRTRAHISSNASLVWKSARTCDGWLWNLAVYREVGITASFVSRLPRYDVHYTTRVCAYFARCSRRRLTYANHKIYTIVKMKNHRNSVFSSRA